MKNLTFLLFFVTLANQSAWSQHAIANAPKTIRFVENKGQWESSVSFRTDLPGGKLFLEKNKLTYSFYDTKFLADKHDHKANESISANARKHQHENNESIDFHAFEVNFIGSNPTPIQKSEIANPEKSNFFLGADKSKWASDVRSFEKVTYQNLYPSIDFAIYEYHNDLKYEFIVAPGTDPSVIQMQYTGADSLFIDHRHLHIKTSVNEIIENPPYIYQQIDGKEIKIKGAFVLKDSTIHFSIGSYNKKHPLIIDPQLIFSTYSGATADNWGNTAAFDEAGNMYSGGTVFHVGFPTTLGAFQMSYGGFQSYGWGIDIGILKYNPTGTGLLYATYLGGLWTDVPYSLIVDHNDDLVIFGSTGSSNFPIGAGAFDNSFNGGVGVQPVSGIIFGSGSDLFVSKLSADGATLLGSTFVGGTNNDGILYDGENLTKNYGDQLRGDVTVDDLNNIYIASNTRSVNFPVTAGPIQLSHAGGGTDAVVFKLSEDLTTMLWGTYLGGAGEDAAYSIQVDSLYNVFVSGGTTSSAFPTTASAYHTTYSGNVDGYITHINSTGTGIISSTFIGTTSYDQTYFVQLDSLENVYVLGQTRGTYPVTAGTYNNPNSGQFIHKLSRDLTTSLMSTVIGSGGFNPNISLTAFLVNDCGNIFLSGWGGENNQFFGYVGGNTNNMPLSSDAFQSTTDGSDFYVMVLSQDASSLLYATYFGGNGSAEHVDGGTSRFDKKGVIYQSVCAGCGGNSLFPTYPNPGAWSNTNQSAFWEGGLLYHNCNNGAFKFDLVSLKAGFTYSKAIDCSNTVVTFTNTSIGGKSLLWDFGDLTSSTTFAPTIHHTYSTPGDYLVTLIATDLTTCIGKDTVSELISIPAPPTINFNTSDTTICKGESVILSATVNPTYTYQWSPSDFLSSTTIANPLANPDRSYLYTVVVSDTNNCVVTKEINLEVLDLRKGLDFGADPDCEGKTKVTIANSTIGKGLLYNWLFSDGFSANTNTNTVIHEYQKAEGTQTVYFSIQSNGCNYNDTLSFTLEKVFIPNLVTPNYDGLNDAFAIQGIGEDWIVEIYNRWGKRIYKNTNYTNDWTGVEFSDGIYYFLITSPNETKCKGWLEILR